nr:unnamed protein product [Callosobruchus analis]
MRLLRWKGCPKGAWSTLSGCFRCSVTRAKTVCISTSMHQLKVSF